MTMILGGVTLPTRTTFTTIIQDISTDDRTQGSTLKRDIRGQKLFYSVSMPTILGADMNSLKLLKEAQANVDFVFPNESGVGNITTTVAMKDFTYTRLSEYTETVWLTDQTMMLEEV